MYPVMLNVRDQRCLVVGGGAVALRKIEGLLDEHARIDVVAREPLPELRQLAAASRVALETRAYRSQDIAGHVLIFAATDDPAVNQQVADDARGAGLWVNVADVPALCSFHLPARLRRGALQLCIASDGEAPFVARRLRQVLEQRFDSEWAAWSEAAAEFRRRVRASSLPKSAQERSFDRFFENTVDGARLAVRVPTPAEMERLLVEAAVPGESGVGFVSLVGAGPGDAGLLTLRGWQRLLRADAVVYDRLAESVLPPQLDRNIELHDVGKQPDHHPVPQEQINEVLVRLARAGKRVVRLKGGDPFVFGRGGEEAEALVEAKIPFEVVPGVTAGVAVPAYAGIPTTHRDDASRLTLVTAHEKTRAEPARVRWDLLAADRGATVVGYMGVSNLQGVVDRLLAYGMDPETPAAMIERGTTSQQRSVNATLGQLPQAVAVAGLRSPAIFVIGWSVRHGPKLDWFSRRPLHGERLAHFSVSAALVEQLERHGVEVVALPRPITPAARVVLAALPVTGWLLGNSEEVDAVAVEASGPERMPQQRVWCRSPLAVARARALGWAHACELAPEATAADVVRAMIAARADQVTARTCS